MDSNELFAKELTELCKRHNKQVFAKDMVVCDIAESISDGEYQLGLKIYPTGFACVSIEWVIPN